MEGCPGSISRRKHTVLRLVPCQAAKLFALERPLWQRDPATAAPGVSNEFVTGRALSVPLLFASSTRGKSMERCVIFCQRPGDRGWPGLARIRVVAKGPLPLVDAEYPDNGWNPGRQISLATVGKNNAYSHHAGTGKIAMSPVVQLRPPTAKKPTVSQGRAKNASYRSREYLTEAEIEKLLATAGKSRNPNRDRLLVLMAYRHALRASRSPSRPDRPEGGNHSHPSSQERHARHPRAPR